MVKNEFKKIFVSNKFCQISYKNVYIPEWFIIIGSKNKYKFDPNYQQVST